MKSRIPILRNSPGSQKKKSVQRSVRMTATPLYHDSPFVILAGADQLKGNRIFAEFVEAVTTQFLDNPIIVELLLENCVVAWNMSFMKENSVEKLFGVMANLGGAIEKRIDIIKGFIELKRECYEDINFYIRDSSISFRKDHKYELSIKYDEFDNFEVYEKTSYK